MAALILVATPIGNLGDITRRALETLRTVDVIACEDTREMKKLLSLLDISLDGRDLLSVHEHNETQQSDRILDLIRSGKSVAYASDAGMPAISDPGARLVDAAIDANVEVVAVPGATAVTTAVALSGFTSTEFTFLGFFPRETKERNNVRDAIVHSPHSVVFYESPQRIEKTVAFLGETLPTRRMCLCREMTKKFEQVIRGTSQHLLEHLDDVKGECVLVVESAQGELSIDETAVVNAIERMKKSKMSSRDVVDTLSPLTQVSKNRIKEIYTELPI
jgi:16S rRNA (cytidine1402-2'-O)-methyltransferase